MTEKRAALRGSGYVRRKSEDREQTWSRRRHRLGKRHSLDKGPATTLSVRILQQASYQAGLAGRRRCTSCNDRRPAQASEGCRQEQNFRVSSFRCGRSPQMDRPGSPRASAQYPTKPCKANAKPAAVPRTRLITARISPSPLRPQPSMDIDSATADKFPKRRLGPCVLAADPLSLTRHPGDFSRTPCACPVISCRFCAKRQKKPRLSRID